MTSILTILSPVTVKAMTEYGCPSRVTSDQHADRAVDQDGTQFATAGRTGLFGHRRRTTDDAWLPGGTELGTLHDIGVEDLDEGVEIGSPRRRVERVDHLPLTREIPIGPGNLRAVDPTPRSAGELPCGRGVSVDDVGDLVEGQVEHVVQHERQPFCRGEPFEYDKRRQAHRVGQQCLLLGVGVSSPDDRVGQVLDQRVFPAAPSGSQLVQALPRDDGGQPRLGGRPRLLRPGQGGDRWAMRVGTGQTAGRTARHRRSTGHRRLLPAAIALPTTAKTTLVLQFDGKGIVVRPETLRPATLKAHRTRPPCGR